MIRRSFDAEPVLTKMNGPRRGQRLHGGPNKSAAAKFFTACSEQRAGVLLTLQARVPETLGFVTLNFQKSR